MASLNDLNAPTDLIALTALITLIFLVFLIVILSLLALLYVAFIDLFTLIALISLTALTFQFLWHFSSWDISVFVIYLVFASFQVLGHFSFGDISVFMTFQLVLCGWYVIAMFLLCCHNVVAIQFLRSCYTVSMWLLWIYWQNYRSEDWKLKFL